MAISGEQVIAIGLQNESIGSDSLYDAFNKVKTNFTNLFDNASQYTTFVAGNGISLTDVPSTGTLTIQNSGVTSIIAGTNITINQANGNVTISSGGGGGGSGVSSVGISSSTLTVSNTPIISAGNIVLDLPTTGVVAAQYTNPTVSVDTYGRITNISNNIVSGTVTSVGVTPGDGIQVSGSPVTTSGNINILNTGVTRLNAGTGISLSGSNGNVTVSTTVTGGTVTGVTVASTTLTVTGSPITTTGTITINLPSTITVTGNITGGNLTTGGRVIATGNVTGGNLTTAGVLSVTGNANTGNLGTTTAIISTGNITTINSGLLQNGNSNITITANGNVSITAAGGTTELVVTSTGANIAGTFNVTGNANVGNLGTAGLVVATGNVTGGNLVTGGALSVTGNANTGNLGTATAIITTGNITTVNSGLLQNGNSNITITANGNVSITASGGTPELVVTSTGANIAGTFNVTGNTDVGNLGTATAIITTGNITTINSGLLQNGTSNIAITNNGNVSITASGGTPELVVTSTGANITGTLSVTGNTDVGNLTTAGSILSNGILGIGYTTGSGGTITQLTSRTTGVTINKISGSITLFTAAGVSAYTSFTVTNSTVAATDTIIVNQKSGTDRYEAFVSNTAAGSFAITFSDRTGTTNEAPVFNFAVIKAVAA
jgi:hypothetical protein